MSERLFLLDTSVVLFLVRGTVLGQNHSGGARNMGKNDLWIAACAKASGAALLTTDKDYLHLDPDQLSVEWVDPAL